MKKKNEIEDLSYNFSLRIVELYKYLKSENMSYGIGNQIFRSGTSIGANVAESKFAQSNLDFISKLSIALKEGNETQYWIRLLRDSEYINDFEARSLLDDCNKIIRILISIIKTCKTKNIVAPEAHNKD